jgi:pimeloyl-ACP methyl ester carboxylesterase
VPYLSRHFRVVTVEGRGNGRADRPDRAEAYSDHEYVEDVLAVMDATGIDRAVLVGLSMGGRHALQFAARHPERALGVVAIGTAYPSPAAPDFDVPGAGYEGWAKYNRQYWLDDYPGFVEFFVSQIFPEPHSTKQIEDGISWGLETDGRTLALTVDARAPASAADVEATCRRVDCPVLILHGDEDAIVPHSTGERLARWTGGQLVTVAGGGHAPPMRDPVLTNRLIRDFAASVVPTRRRSWSAPDPGRGPAPDRRRRRPRGRPPPRPAPGSSCRRPVGR